MRVWAAFLVDDTTHRHRMSSFPFLSLALLLTTGDEGGRYPCGVVDIAQVLCVTPVTVYKPRIPVAVPARGRRAGYSALSWYDSMCLSLDMKRRENEWLNHQLAAIEDLRYADPERQVDGGGARGGDPLICFLHNLELAMCMSPCIAEVRLDMPYWCCLRGSVWLPGK